MSVVSKAARAVALAAFTGALLTLAVWLFWYGQDQWAGTACKVFRRAIPGGAPAAWVTSGSCALKWHKPVLRANVLFLFLAPAVAALAAIALMGLREHPAAAAGSGSSSSSSSHARHTLQAWGSTLLPPKRLWLWWCDGLTVKDALVVSLWAVWNAVWFSTILGKAFSLVPPGLRSPRLYAKAFASLMSPNLVPLLFPVSRGSAINNVLGISYPEGIRWHRWLGQWVLMLISLHGLIYWLSWAADGRWIQSALRMGQDTNNLLGGVALVFALLLWATSQEPVRRRYYSVYKTLHHIGFWGFMLMGCAHHWSLVWNFVPGMLLYALDGVFRLHQMFAGNSGDLSGANAVPTRASKSSKQSVNTEVLRVDVDPAGTMVSLLLAVPDFGAAPAGVVWLNVPSLSRNQWHAFDYTASRVFVGADGAVLSSSKDIAAASGCKERTVLSVHIKAYSRWTRRLVSQLSAGGGGQHSKLAIRMQGPYADPPAHIGQPDGVILVAGGNGIASALPVFEELSAAGVRTRGLPALLVWACRKGHEFEFMAARVLAAAQALGLDLTLKLHVTDGVELAEANSVHAGTALGSTAAANKLLLSDDTKPTRDQLELKSSARIQVPPVTAMALSAASTTSSSSDSSEGGCGRTDTGLTTDSVEPAAYEVSTAAAAAVTATAKGGVEHSNNNSSTTSSCGSCSGSDAAPTSLCPVVAFASFAAQLSFKAVLHLAVFAGFLAGLALTIHVGATLPVAAGKLPWETLALGPSLVLIPGACAVASGLVTLWIGLFVQRRQRGLNWGSGHNKSPVSSELTTPAAAIAAASGKLSQLTPATAKVGSSSGKGASTGVAAAAAAAAPFMLHIPTLSGGLETLPVADDRPSVKHVVQAWISTLQQLPTASTAGKDSNSSASHDKLHCVVYGCGPTPLDHDTQLAVTSVAAKQRRRREGGAKQVVLSFVRKAQQL